MVSMYAALRSSGGIEAVARRLAVPTPAAQEAVAALLPLVLGALRRRVDGATGDAAAVLAIEDMLEGFGGSKLVAAVIGGGALPVDAGEALAVAVFGSQRTVDAVRAHIADGGDDGRAAGVTSAALPLLTMLVGGYISARIGSIDVIDVAASDEIMRLLDVGAPVNPLDAIAP